MSRYLRFALRHAGAPEPRRIAILKTGVDWADDQLVDEFRFQFPRCDVDLVLEVRRVTQDLLVLPYFEVLFAKAPTAAKCREMSSSGVAWVMLYGLDYRRIKVLPAKKAVSYYRWAIALHQLEGCVARSTFRV